MHGSVLRTIALALSLVVFTVASASADGVEKRGRCSGGRGELRLEVRVETGRLRVRFGIDHVPAGQAWQIFLSDDGVGIYSGTRRTDRNGEVRVTVDRADRRGRDRIAASGVSMASGVSCEGSLTI